jgi:hypothetical protein
MGNQDDFLDLSVVYNQWAGVGRYKVGGSREDQAFHKNREEAWNKILDMLLAYEIGPDDPYGFTEEDRQRVVQEIEQAKTFKARTTEEVRNAYNQAGFEYFMEHGKFPSTSDRLNYLAIGINHHRWFGWGIFRPDTESKNVGHLRTHDSRADAYKSVRALVEQTQPSEKYSAELLAQRMGELNKIIEEAEKNDWDKSIYGRPAARP